MRRAGGLFERVAGFGALCAAARRAAKGKRLSEEAMRFLLDLEPEVLRLERELRDGSYRPAAYRTFRIADPKPRVISAAAFRDRVVHHALCAAMERRLEAYAVADSYACRPGKGQQAALTRLQALTRAHRWFLKLDVLHFFETVDHEVLRQLLRRLFKDRRLLALCDRFIDLGAPGSPPGRGLPIGNLTSQHFANAYLGPLDHMVKERLRVPGYVRYMDDMVFVVGSRAEARAVQHAVRAFVEGELRLRLRDDAERRGPVASGVPFLGFRVWPGLVRFDSARKRRFARRIRELVREHEAGRLDDEAFARSAASLCGWAGQGATGGLRRSVLAALAAGGRLPE